MILSFVRRQLSIRICLMLLPLLLAGLGSFSWFVIADRSAALEQENFNKARTAAIVGAEGMEHFLEELVNSGVYSEEQVFDRNYRKIVQGPLAGTQIPKYHTAYDAYLDDRIRHVEDAFLTDETIVFAVLVDENGYLPTHNSRYSRLLSGHDKQDRARNRTKRIFDDPVGLKAAHFAGGGGQQVLRQTYPRDTGVTMWDVSAPVEVFGRHWGAFRIGLSMERTEAEIAQLRRSILTASAGFGLLTLLAMILLIRRSTAPLQRLSRAACTLAAGRHQEPLSIDSADEVGELVRVFNQMQVSLEKTTVSRDYFDRIVNSVHDLLMVISTDGALLRINRAVKETFGIDAEQVLGRQVDEFYSGRHGENDWYHRLLSEHRLEAEDVFLPRKDGEPLALSLSASPLRGEEGEIDGYVIVCQDNTRRIRAEREMESAFDQAFALNSQLREVNDAIEMKNQELDDAYRKLKASQSQILQQEKMASIGQLAAGVAHEINNPLGFITSNLQSLGKYLDRLDACIDEQKLLLEEKLDAAESQQLRARRKKLKIDYILEDGHELIAESLDGAGRVKTIVQNLKSFSRVDQAEVALVNLNECLESTICIAWNELKYKITLEKRLGELAPLVCHPQQLNQVFLNLLLNAAQAIEKRGTIWVSTRQDDENQYVEIRDDGSGIPADIQQKIFEPFFTTKEVGKGTGLGMSTSYDIIQSHGGHIDLQSEPGVGTSFTIVLPRATQEGMEVRDA